MGLTDRKASELSSLDGLGKEGPCAGIRRDR